MRILLDTHIFLWFISGDQRLSTDYRKALCEASNEIYRSVISIWEAVVKHHLGKLPLPASPESYLPEQRIKHQIASLALEEEDIATLAKMPKLHRDPFDHLLMLSHCVMTCYWQQLIPAFANIQ